MGEMGGKLYVGVVGWILSLDAKGIVHVDTKQTWDRNAVLSRRLDGFFQTEIHPDFGNDDHK